MIGGPTVFSACDDNGTEMSDADRPDGSDHDADLPELDADDRELGADETALDALDADDADHDSDSIEPPDDLSGPPCPEPQQVPIDESWPEVFVGIDACDAGGRGANAATPVCTFGRAFEIADSVPYIVTILDGEYRITDDSRWSGSYSVNREGSPEACFVVRAAPGARPVILASIQIDGSRFEDRGNGQWRVSVDDVLSLRCRHAATKRRRSSIARVSLQGIITSDSSACSQRAPSRC